MQAQIGQASSDYRKNPDTKCDIHDLHDMFVGLLVGEDLGLDIVCRSVECNFNGVHR